ncbi:MAG: hypothetical protein PVG65_04115 [Candidatus Thorarchaeota archaeon]|jgi:hypothetical protein
MESAKKLSIGAFLATIGALGIIINFVLGPTNMGRVLDFIVGFCLGILIGLGGALSISGLLESRYT